MTVNIGEHDEVRAHGWSHTPMPSHQPSYLPCVAEMHPANPHGAIVTLVAEIGGSYGDGNSKPKKITPAEHPKNGSFLSKILTIDPQLRSCQLPRS